MEKLTLLEVLEHLIEDETTWSLLKEIKKERGNDKIYKSQEQIREQRKKVLNNLNNSSNTETK